MSAASARSARSGVSPARACAFTVVRRVSEQGAYADRALHACAAGLDPRDRALATALAYGAVQRSATLDYVIERLSSRPIASVDPPVLAALRLGLFQLLFLDGVAEHAAVHESVELAKRSGPGAARFANAVLRRATREGRAMVDALDGSTPAGAAIAYSVPEWLAAMWFADLGRGRAQALLRSINRPAESALRANTLSSSVQDVLARLPVAARQATDVPEGIVLEAPFDAHGSPLFADGAIMPQSRGSMLVARALDPRPGERVLDLCAAPGAKSTHLAALMGNDGAVIAVERHPGRAAALERTCRRMHATSVRVQAGDAALARADGPFERVLVDPPCSGLGTLQSRPDIRWRASPEAIVELAALQRRILAAGAAATAVGGTLVYSVCTISRAESEKVVEWLLSTHQEFSPAGAYRQLTPDADGTDGFFIARLRRT
jgi:16S rRNA (cytosine967-C5)-methyltransferase